MKGVTAEDPPKIISSAMRRMLNITGNNHHFLRSQRNFIKSRINSNILEITSKKYIFLIQVYPFQFS